MPNKTPSRSWNEFEKKGRSVSQTPMLTIQKLGSFYLNQACRDALGGSKLEAVVLMADDAHPGVIGVRSAKPAEAKAYSVTPTQQGRGDRGFVVSGRSFCKDHGIRVDETRKFAGHLEDGVLVFEVGE